MPDLNEGRLDLPRSGPRFIAFGVAAIVLITALGGRLFQLQVVQGDEFARRAAADRTVEVPVPAPRGLIFDRAGRPVAVNTPSWTVKVRPADLPARPPIGSWRAWRESPAVTCRFSGSGCRRSTDRHTTSCRSSAGSLAMRRCC